MPVNMTAHWIDRLKPPDNGRAEYFDEKIPGLILRVTATGKKSWFLMYRVKGDLKKRRKALGAMPPVDLAAARQEAQKFLLAVADGEDPDEIRAEEKRNDGLDGPYFKDLAADFIEKYAKIKKRTWKDDEWLLGKELLPVIGSKKAKMIKRRDIIDLVIAIHDRGAPIQANRTLALVRKIYNWAIERDVLEATPCLNVKAPGEEHQRDRVLTEDEIRKVWTAFDGQGDVIGAMFKLRLVTAQRGGEVESMQWKDLDLTNEWWTIPSHVAKNKLSHRVPLSVPALGLLNELRLKTGNQEWVFPSPRGGCGHISNIHKAAQRVQEASGVDFVMHDLRRTAASYMTSLGVQRLVVSKILNHVEAGITRVYDRHSYDAEKRQALDTWAKKLLEILSKKE